MDKAGKIYVVGIGPGSYEGMTLKAVAALNKSQVIVGYAVYVDLLRETFPSKRFLETPMRREVERCQMAFDEAQKGQDVSMVCSGDPGVYGMSGLILELAKEYPEVEIEIVPGVTAATAGAALLGAPLGHDFAVISLSDLLTPMELIEERIKKAAEADFILCIYNPSSRKRADYLRRACEIVLQYRDPETVCGIVQNIGREGEGWKAMTLAELKDTAVDMFTTVYIGSSRTVLLDGKMVTPRGYRRG